MIGPLKGGSHKKKYLLVVVDRFTKWIDVKPVKTAEAEPVIDFISVTVFLTASSSITAPISQPMK